MFISIPTPEHSVIAPGSETLLVLDPFGCMQDLADVPVQKGKQHVVMMTLHGFNAFCLLTENHTDTPIILSESFG